MLSLICLLLCTHVDSVKASSDDASLSPSLDALLSLMTLTDNLCQQLDWCTVRNTTLSKRLGDGCCPSCSCEQSCFSTQSCCPDINLSKLLDGKVFSDIDDLIHFISKETNTEMFDEPVFYDGKDEQININTTQCIESSLFHASAIWKKRPSYQMVCKCSNNTTSISMKTKCESQQFAVLPVQSLKTGVVYRNSYCALCNDLSIDDFIEWDIYLATTLNPDEFVILHFNVMHDVLAFLFKEHNIEKTAIYFEPGTQLREAHPSKVCHEFDVETCTTAKETTTPTKITCQQFLLPAYTKYGRQLTAYKNIACATCSDVEPDEIYTCNVWDNWDSEKPFLARISNALIRGEDDESGKERSSTDIDVQFSPQCNTGHVFDRQMNLCRKLYCPNRMVIVDSKCVWMFQEVHNMVFEIFVGVSKPELPAKVRNITSFQLAIFQYFVHAFKVSDKFAVIQMNMWISKGKNSIPKGTFIHVIFAGKYSDHVSYRDAVTFVAKHMRGQKNIKDKTWTYLAKLTLTDPILIRIGQLTDLNTDYVYDLEMSYGDGDARNHPSRTRLQLHDEAFCYRIALFAEEVVVRGRAVFIKQSRTIVRHFATMVSNDSSILVCADKVLPSTPNAMDFADHTIADPVVVKYGGHYEYFKLVVVGWCILAFCYILVVQMYIRGRSLRRQRQRMLTVEG